MPATAVVVRRLALVGVAGATMVSLVGCGSSSTSKAPASGASAATSATSGGASTAGATSDTSSSSAATTSSAASTGNGSTNAGGHFTAAQLDAAMKATTVDGKSVSVVPQGTVHETVSGMAKSQAEMARTLKISPEACRQAFLNAQPAPSVTGTSVVSMGAIGGDEKSALYAVQLPADSPDKWDASALEKCHNVTTSGTIEGIPFGGTETMTPVDVPASQATNPHGIAIAETTGGKTTHATVALARVGDVELEAAHSTEVSGQQLAAELDALASQLKKLG